MNYYNEHDPYAAAWLRNLISAGLIPAGEVDERSIEDVRPNELRGFTQCHFFAGIGGWSLALDLAGWPRDMPVWTGSCPCQPFSAAGRGDGFADERHLWPAWFHLVRECRPQRVFGEQVASAIGHGWFDLVSADMEAEGYAIGGAVLGAHSVAAPHQRQRLYWMADASGAGLAQQFGERRIPRKVGGGPTRKTVERDGSTGRMGNSYSKHAGRDARTSAIPQGRLGLRDVSHKSGASGAISGMADANGRNAGTEREQCGREQRFEQADGGAGDNGSARASDSPWSAADWLRCRDGKWRPAIPSYVTLVDGVSAGMVFAVSRSQNHEREEVNAAPITAGPREKLQGLRSSRPPRGREPFEQRTIQLEDVVPILPSQIALAELQGRRSDADALRALCAAICEAGAVRYSPDAAAAAWTSLGKEAKDRVRMGVGGAFARVTFHLLSTGELARVVRLRAYGNAIVPQTAAAFIRAGMSQAA